MADEARHTLDIMHSGGPDEEVGFAPLRARQSAFDRWPT